MKFISRLFLVLLPIAGGLVSCSTTSQVKAVRPVSYHYEGGHSALLRDGIAFAPPDAPASVWRAIVAGNRLQKMPYKWGGGHANHYDNGYDCSGTVSFVLGEAGLMGDAIPSRGLFGYGEPGEGKWITIYTCKGHAFITIGGLRLDTGGPGGGSGPRWKPETREVKGYVMRHPVGF